MKKGDQKRNVGAKGKKKKMEDRRYSLFLFLCSVMDYPYAQLLFAR